MKGSSIIKSVKNAKDLQYDVVKSYLQKEFFGNEVIYKYFNNKRIEKKDYQITELDEKAIKLCASSGLSIAICNDYDEIIGMFLSMRCSDYIKLEPIVDDESKIVLELFSRLNNYLPEDIENSVYEAIYTVRSDYYGKGLTSFMNSYKLRLFMENGVVETFGDCTHFQSLKIMEKAGYTSKVKLKYRDFEFEGKKVFDDWLPEDETIDRVAYKFSKI